MQHVFGSFGGTVYQQLQIHQILLRHSVSIFSKFHSKCTVQHSLTLPFLKQTGKGVSLTDVTVVYQRPAQKGFPDPGAPRTWISHISQFSSANGVCSVVVEIVHVIYCQYAAFMCYYISILHWQRKTMKKLSYDFFSF